MKNSKGNYRVFAKFRGKNQGKFVISKIVIGKDLEFLGLISIFTIN